MTDKSFQTDVFAARREAMVSNQLRTTAVNDPVVVAAMRMVPRERFVPADQVALAYLDRSVPLGRGRALNPPMATGRLLTEAHPQPGERALVVGAGGGYAAALLAEIGLDVVALETDASFLAGLRGLRNVEIVEGPLGQGWAAGAPYDLILVDGALPEAPEALIAQLAEGGRLAFGLIDNGVTRLAIGRRAGGGFGCKAFADADAVTLPGFGKPPVFSF